MQDNYVHSRYKCTVDICLIEVLDKVTCDIVSAKTSIGESRRSVPKDAKVSKAASSLNMNHLSSFGLSKVSQR